MASSNNNMSFWLKFFVDAGIPAGEAANHAVTFTDHRIQTDMLLDLNKEYLNEMGISMMGDVIAILKHANPSALKRRLTYNMEEENETAREKALKTPPSATVSPVPRRSTPASRIVDHYLGAANDPDARPMNERTTFKMSTELAARLGPTPAAKEPAAKTAVTKIQLLSTQKEEVPVPKSRRVFPEHEGKYKITMPKGSTARSKKILQKKGVTPPKSSTVFDRLGGGKDDGETSLAGSSVFSRLGGKSAIKRPATSTSVDPGDSLDDDDEPGSPLEYAGVLKDIPNKKFKPSLDLKKVPAITISNTSIAKCEDMVHSEGVLASGKTSVEKKSVLSRLGGPVVSAATSSTSLGTPATTSKVKKTSLARRLGPQRTEVSSSEDAKPKGVFSRLGKPK